MSTSQPQTQPQAQPQQQEPPQTQTQSQQPQPQEQPQAQTVSTKLYFPNGNILSHQSESALDLSNLQYKVVSEALSLKSEEETVIYLDKNTPGFQRLLAEAKRFSGGLSKKEADTVIESAFKADSDGDGVIDILDKNPTAWNVSERDLRAFSVLAYEKGSDLWSAFNNKSPKALHSFKDGAWKVGKVDVENMDLDILTKNWELMRFKDTADGLQYAVFGNKAGTTKYQNIVVAFRGTQATSASDLAADLKIYDQKLPSQVKHLNELADYLGQFNAQNIYSTGHSLGGYLAQYFAAETMQSSAQRANKFTHSALFNPVPLPNAGETAKARQLSEQFAKEKVTDENFNKTASYVIKGEFVSDGALLAGLGIAAGETVKNTAKGFGLGLLGGLLLAPFTGGTSLVAATVAGTAVGAGVGAAKGIANGASAVDGLGYYGNTTLFDFKSDKIWGKHDLATFFENNGKLKIHFTNGYRMDSYYRHDDQDRDGLTDYQEARIGTSVSLKDTDGDGIDDTIEVRVGANPLMQTETPWAKTSPETEFDATPLLMFAEVTDKQGTQLKGIVLTPEQQGDGVLYQAAEIIAINEALNPSLLIDPEQLHANAVGYLNGTAGDDIFTLGAQATVINSGAGKDQFMFTQAKNNAIAYLNDFDLTQDKVVFNRDAFSELNELKYAQTSGQLFYKDLHIATFEQGLALSAQQVEFI